MPTRNLCIICGRSVDTQPPHLRYSSLLHLRWWSATVAPSCQRRDRKKSPATPFRPRCQAWSMTDMFTLFSQSKHLWMIQQRAKWYNKGPFCSAISNYRRVSSSCWMFFFLIIAHQCSVLVRICTRLQLIHHFKGNIPTQTWFFSLNTGVLRLQHGRHPMVLSAKDDQIAVPQQHRPAVHRQNPGRPEGKPQSVGVSVRFRDNLQKILEPWNKTMDKQWNLTSISVFGSIVANQVNPNNGRLM